MINIRNQRVLSYQKYSKKNVLTEIRNKSYLYFRIIFFPKEELATIFSSKKKQQVIGEIGLK